MLGSFLNRILILAFGYAYPAYECFKIVEKNKPDIENLRFWCQYWILVALLATLERVGDFLISWFPLYHEAKLAFYIYLWFPRTKGTVYVYESTLRPFLAKNENKIDSTLLEFRARAADTLAIFFLKFATFGQAKFLEILQFVMMQSHSIGSRYSQRRQQSQPQRQQQQHQVHEEEVLKPPPMVHPCRSVYEPPPPPPQRQQQQTYNSVRSQVYERYTQEYDKPPPDHYSKSSEVEPAQEVTNVGNGRDSYLEPNESANAEYTHMPSGRSKKTE